MSKSLQSLSCTPIEYPSLLKRYQSNFIDRIVTYIFIGVLLYGAISFSAHSLPLKVMAILVAMSYEPLLLAFNHRTVGQVITGIRVRHLSIDQRMPLLNAFARFWLRMLLGWTTYLTIHSNNQRQALHDIATDTVVVVY